MCVRVRVGCACMCTCGVCVRMTVCATNEQSREQWDIKL